MFGGSDRLFPAHGGYRKLRSFQVAQIVYDCTLLFCRRFISKNSRTYDQMVQAARSGVQNIAERLDRERRKRLSGRSDPSDKSDRSGCSRALWLRRHADDRRKQRART